MRRDTEVQEEARWKRVSIYENRKVGGWGVIMLVVFASCPCCKQHIWGCPFILRATCVVVKAEWLKYRPSELNEIWIWSPDSIPTFFLLTAGLPDCTLLASFYTSHVVPKYYIEEVNVVTQLRHILSTLPLLRCITFGGLMLGNEFFSCWIQVIANLRKNWIWKCHNAISKHHSYHFPDLHVTSKMAFVNLHRWLSFPG